VPAVTGVAVRNHVSPQTGGRLAACFTASSEKTHYPIINRGLGVIGAVTLIDFLLYRCQRHSVVITVHASEIIQMGVFILGRASLSAEFTAAMLAKIPLHSMKRAVSDNIQGIAVLAVNGLFVDNPIKIISVL